MSARVLAFLTLVVTVPLAALIQQTPARPEPFTTPYVLEEMADKQAVVETSMGTFIFDLLPEVAPNHVGFFMKQAEDGAYVGTTFHRLIRYGIIQGGDPLSKDPAKSAQYGTGGMRLLKSEFSDETHSIGTVSAVLAPGEPDSGGAQFFVCANPQRALDGQYTVFGRVVDGIDVVQTISAVEVDTLGLAKERVTIEAVTIRDTPPPVVDPFLTATADEMAGYRAVLATSEGEIEVEFLPGKAPETVRNFLQLAAAGVYDETLVHRAVSDFVIQTGAPAFRTTPLSARQAALIHNLPPEFTDTPNVPGVLSMARGEDPGSGTTSFFICAGECRSLDGQYTVFGQVVRGMDIVQAIASVEVDADGETPRMPILVRTVTVISRQ